MFGYELHRAGPKLRFLPDHPEIIRISNRQEEGNPNTGHYWHSDGHYMADPSSITIMHIVHATVNGVTLVTDTAKAFDRLPAENKKIYSPMDFSLPKPA